MADISGNHFLSRYACTRIPFVALWAGDNRIGTGLAFWAGNNRVSSGITFWAGNG